MQWHFENKGQVILLEKGSKRNPFSICAIALQHTGPSLHMLHNIRQLDKISC